MDSMKTMIDIAKMQEKYKELVESKKLSKRAICELCVPFRDKYGLTDKQTLMIAREELTFAEIVNLIGGYDI